LGCLPPQLPPRMTPRQIGDVRYASVDNAWNSGRLGPTRDNLTIAYLARSTLQDKVNVIPRHCDNETVSIRDLQ
jgi:hypothetical protein